ncbi:MAG: type II toxin-antitoxin system RelE/ParE family toxin [Candidatus Hodarchaeota archaeon]
MTDVIILAEAKEEIKEATSFYESRDDGLGLDFLSEVELAIKLIEESPKLCPILEGNLRRCLLKRFPFGILFYIEPERIVIVAVAHFSRKPGYWKERLQSS